MPTAMIDFVLFGNMCAGKSTVGQILRHELGYEVVAAKDVVRKNLAAATDEVKRLRGSGYLLPDAVMTRWIFDAVEDAARAGSAVVLDGFPRTAPQAQALLATYAARPTVVSLDFDLATLKRRFDHRVLCDGCDMPYSRLFADFAGECAYCRGRAMSPRPTDRPDYFAVKTGQFETVSRAVIPVLRAAALPFVTVKDHARFADLRAEAAQLGTRSRTHHA